MATTKRPNDETPTRSSTRTTKRPNDKKGEGDLRYRWGKAVQSWRQLLPPKCYGDLQGTWRYAQPETDAEKLAAGWEPLGEAEADERDPEKIAAWKPKDAADLARGPRRGLGYQTWNRGPADAPRQRVENALADVVEEIADAATGKMPVPMLELRRFARELRESRGTPSRNPELLFADVELVVADVLRVVDPEAADEPNEIDLLKDDQTCIEIAQALAGGPKTGMRSKPMCTAAPDSGTRRVSVAHTSTTFKDRKRRMLKAGLIEQTKDRMPMRLTPKGRKLYGL